MSAKQICMGKKTKMFLVVALIAWVGTWMWVIDAGALKSWLSTSFGCWTGLTCCCGLDQHPSSELAALAEEQEQIASALEKHQMPSRVEFLVDFEDRLTEGEVFGILSEHGFVEAYPVSVSQNPHQIYRVLVGLESTIRLEALFSKLDLLRHSPGIEAADVNWSYGIPEDAPDSLTHREDEGIVLPSLEGPALGMTPNDPMYRYQWHMEQIGMPKAWSKTQGKGAIVAVIDTGITKVEDLEGTEFVPGWNFVTDTEDARDDHGHGTHVAGTIAQTTNNQKGVAGIAFQAKLMPIKVLSASGSGSVAGIAAGIRWAVDHGANVINMSLGGPFRSTALANAVTYARSQGVVVVCAAGNDGKGRVSFPAAVKGAIAVAATQYDGATTFYSNWGKEIAIAAPGGNTRLDQNGDGMPDGVLQHTVTPGQTDKQDYLLFMGTSMASPHVAGVAALLYGLGVKDPERIEQILKDTALRPKQYEGDFDPHYGAGILQADTAVARAMRERGL